MKIRQEVEAFLRDFKTKMGIWGIVYLDNRPKNVQTLLTLDITPARRTTILKELEVKDYSKGPVAETLHGGAAMWVFGKTINQREVYIKITMGMYGEKVICISFHLAERAMEYPLKNSES